MSVVTNAMLFFGCGEVEPLRMAEVNTGIAYRDPDRKQQFEDGHRMEWYGGTKCMEAPFWGAAFNYVGLRDIVESVFGPNVQWAAREKVLLLVCDQEDMDWNIYNHRTYEAMVS